MTSLDQQIAEAKRKLAMLESGMNARQLSPEEEKELASIQRRAARVFELNAKPLPVYTNQTPDQYRRQLADVLKVNSSMARHDLSREPESVFAQSEAKIYADAEARYLKPRDLAPGEIREVKFKDRTGRDVTEFAVGPGESVFKKVYGKCVGNVGHRVTFIHEDKPLAVPDLAGPRGF